MVTPNKCYEDYSKEDEGELLAVILDTSFNPKLVNSNTVPQLLDSVVTFCNGHLLNSSKNQLVVVACHPHTAKLVYPSANASIQNTRPVDGQMEVLAYSSQVGTIQYLLNTFERHFPPIGAGEASERQRPSNSIGLQVIRDGLKEVVTSWHGVYNTEPLLTGGMSLALCYIAKKISANPLNKLHGRLLVIRSSRESAHQYLNLMNVFFAAQRKGIVVDSCVVETDCGLLQQGADITGGSYLKVPSMSGLLEYLLWVFLPSKTLRSRLVLPKADVVDYRTACFCHRNLVEVGYVCSVCLSIFCTFAPICSTCRTHFKFMGSLPTLLRQKTKNKELQAPLM